jgi:hypothetical protein
MRTLLLMLSLAALAPAQEREYTVYQTVVTFHANQDLVIAALEVKLSGTIKREYSRAADGREVLAQSVPAHIKDPGHPLHLRQIWEPNGVMTVVILPMKHTRTVVESGNGRLSGNTKPGSTTCEPVSGVYGAAVYVGKDSLQGIETYRWKESGTRSATDRWYWKEANCLEVQSQLINKNPDGAIIGDYTIRLDRVTPNADMELFFVPPDFVEGSSVIAERKYMEATRGKDYLKGLPDCYRRGAERADTYEADHAEALRRRALSTTTNSDKQ